MYVSYHQYYWNTWLPLAEFSYSNSYHYSTKQSLFFTVYGRDPQLDSAQITQEIPDGKLATKIQSVQQEVKRELEVAIDRLKRYADKSRERPPVFNPGDMVSFLQRISNKLYPQKTCLKDGLVLFQS
ncbi:hypothetical protein O181_027075 [Austropuccinia psidii MF-1]|uniref:Uncharacterized protein n=1 Tax=Austropuccinia psidii MF-1 TaxID=1389203 RepID=A0A9Q3H2U2_9BASI|nr:hypothetical protein [Austropuccinia psidii MF-1]